MNKESLIEIRKLLIETLLNNKTINQQDKLEIEMMLIQLLDPNEYEENRKVLQKEYYKKKWR